MVKVAVFGVLNIIHSLHGLLTNRQTKKHIQYSINHFYTFLVTSSNARLDFAWKWKLFHLM